MFRSVISTTHIPHSLPHAVVVARWRWELGEGASTTTRRAPVAAGAADGGRERHREDLAISGADAVSAVGAVGGATMGICFLLGRPPLKYRRGGSSSVTHI
jgi:hypothetical protein